MAFNEPVLTKRIPLDPSQRTVGDVQRFIDVYDPKTGAVPEGLPVGKE